MNVAVVSKWYLLSVSVLFSVSLSSLRTVPWFSVGYFSTPDVDDDDIGQLSHAASHQYIRRQLLALRFDEHRGPVWQCTFDLVAQLGCYDIEAVELFEV